MIPDELQSFVAQTPEDVKRKRNRLAQRKHRESKPVESCWLDVRTKPLSEKRITTAQAKYGTQSQSEDAESPGLTMIASQAHGQADDMICAGQHNGDSDVWTQNWVLDV